MERIRRNRSEKQTIDVLRLETLMKSISDAQDRIVEDEFTIKAGIASLYAEMKSAGISNHVADGLMAELFRPAGRATNVIDPQAFHQAVESPQDFYSSIKVSIEAAKKVLSGKQLLPITTHTPAKLGEETVRVRHVDEDGKA
jgi:hypothetical protein